MKLGILFYFLLLNYVILFYQISCSSIKMSMKNIRNVYNQCLSESNCQECAEEGYYKVCRSFCYCCNFDNQCRAQY